MECRLTLAQLLRREKAIDMLTPEIRRGDRRV
jgi:hypothetical protein